MTEHATEYTSSDTRAKRIERERKKEEMVVAAAIRLRGFGEGQSEKCCSQKWMRCGWG